MVLGEQTGRFRFLFLFFVIRWVWGGFLCVWGLRGGVLIRGGGEEGRREDGGGIWGDLRRGGLREMGGFF